MLYTCDACTVQVSLFILLINVNLYEKGPEMYCEDFRTKPSPQLQCGAIIDNRRDIIEPPLELGVLAAVIAQQYAIRPLPHIHRACEHSRNIVKYQTSHIDSSSLNVPN